MNAAPSAASRWRRRVLLLLLALALSAALLEAGARLLWPLPAAMATFQQAGMYCEAEAGYALVPGYRGRLRIGDTGRDTAIAIDADGLRGAVAGPTPGAADSDPLRVLVVGDSLVFGYGVECEETFAHQLGPQLSALLGRPALGRNGGVPGYGTRLAAAHAQDLLARLEADALVFSIYLGNDFVDDRQQYCVCAGLFLQGPFAELARQSARVRLALRSRFWLWFETWLFTNHPQSSPLAAAFAADAAAVASDLPRPELTFGGLFLDVADEQHVFGPGAPPAVPATMAILRESLRQARSAAAGRPMLVLVLPTRWHVHAADWRERAAQLGFREPEFRFGALRERIAAVARELDCPLLDAAPELAQHGDVRALFIEDGGHLSPAGHLVVARAVAAVLAAHWR